MNGIFVDTSGWYAAIDRKDHSHEAACLFLENNRLPLVTTDYVMDETVTLLQVRLGHGYAVRFLDSLQATCWSRCCESGMMRCWFSIWVGRTKAQRCPTCSGVAAADVGHVLCPTYLAVRRY